MTTAAMTTAATAAAIAASASLCCSVLILATQRWHGSLSMDKELSGPQKFHRIPVPRVGGVALLVGLLAACAVAFSRAWNEQAYIDAAVMSMLVIAALPAFLSGLFEDLTKRVGVTTRLLATFASPLLAAWMLGAVLPRVDVPGLDLLMQALPLALVVTALAVAGVTNAINIIDGFNGLAGFTGVIILGALAWVAWGQGDILLTGLALTGMGAVSGFLLLNYPSGKLFLGDCGAYLLGFWIAEVAVLLVVRNPQVTPWQLLAICAYPVIEVLYSIYRKKLVRHMSPGVPDRLHFHMLVHRRLICCVIPASHFQSWFRNASTTFAILLFIAPFSVAAALVGHSIAAALGLILAQLFVYLALYARLVRGHWCLNPAVGLGLRSEHRPRSNA